MNLTFLGTASGMPVTHRKSSAILLEGKGWSVLFDAGEGVTSSLLTLGKSIDDICRIYISHTHADHVSGLPVLLQYMHLHHRSAPLYIVCDQRLHVWLLEMLRGMYLVPVRWEFPLQFVNFSFEEFTAADGPTVSAVENAHFEEAKNHIINYGVPPVCYSFVVRAEDRTLFISSDIGSVNDVLPHVPRVDSAIVEATHVTMDDLYTLAGENPRVHFYFTHIPPEIDGQIEEHARRFREAYGERVQFAHDGMTVQIGDEVRVG